MAPQLLTRFTELDGVIEISPSTNFEDFRGSYVEIYNEQLFESAGIDTDFVQDDISESRRNVLRGIHGDFETWKLISCLKGAFYLLVVDNRPDSETYMQWKSFTMSDRNRKQILVPPGCGNGHLVLTETAIFHYKQSTYYNRDSQFTILWNDPAFNFWWPIGRPILSRRDSGLE